MAADTPACVSILPDRVSPEDGNIEAGDPCMKQSQSNKRPRKERGDKEIITLYEAVAVLHDVTDVSFGSQ